MVQPPPLSADDLADVIGETLERQTRLDRDLIGKVDPRLLNPVRPVRSRTPEEVALVYKGARKGISPGAIDVTVPDTENAERVEQAVASLALVDERDWDKEAGCIKVDLHERLHLSGPSYHFAKDETTLVHKDDVAFLLAHLAHHIVRAGETIIRNVGSVSAGDHQQVLDRLAALEAQIEQTARPRRRRKETTHGTEG